MPVTSTQEGFAITGAIDFTTVTVLLAESLPLLATRDQCVVDLSQVTTVNSAAMALFAQWERYARQHQKQWTLTQSPTQLQGLLAVVNAAAIFKGCA